MKNVISRIYTIFVSKMGLNKFITVVGGTIASGLTTGIILLNVIPDNPQEIKPTVENINNKETI